MIKNIPYTYLIGWSSLNLFYYGVQYKKNSNPANLFVTYFTSSNHVHKIYRNHGLPDIIEIRKTFSSNKKALLHEHKVLRRLKAKDRNDFLNQTNGRDWTQSSSGLKWIRNHEDAALATKMKYIKIDDPVPEEWFLGGKSTNRHQKCIRNHKDAALATKLKFIKEGETIPEGWFLGGKAPSELHRLKIREANLARLPRTEEQRREASKRMKQLNRTGENNTGFKGYWILPHGKFATKFAALNSCPYHIGLDTIIKWCKTKNDQTITSSHWHSSEYLQMSFPLMDCVGKTFYEIGFGFDPKA